MQRGSTAGSIVKINGSRYRIVGMQYDRVYAHRLIWFLYYGVWSDKIIDHINGNGLDNRIANLRESSSQENNRNRRMHRNNTSGYTGVCWSKQMDKWKASIRDNGKAKHLGFFQDKMDAVAAYESAKTKLGYSARHGKYEPIIEKRTYIPRKGFAEGVSINPDVLAQKRDSKQFDLF